jgi:tetratricopeptide (TPR) repeat protein
MAKKKRKRSRPRRRRPAQNEPAIVDRRTLEAAMHELIAQFHGLGSPDTPLAQAQELMCRAFNQPAPQRRIALAQEALALCPDCADAYVLLAEHAPTRKEALALWEQAVAAGQRALGPRFFQEEVGHFWSILETRAFMRAKEGLASALWAAGRRAEAMQHLRDLLQLNPNDNQGVRYTLASFLLNEDRDDDLAHLLRQYPDEDSTFWTYTRALLAFRQGGDSPEARRLLDEARQANRHVPTYLLGHERLPEEQPPHYSPGRENEAIVYARMFLSGWRNASGAITWLRQMEKKTQEPPPPPKGPLTFIKSWVQRHLPPLSDIWQADFRQVPDWIMVGGERVRPWTVLVTSRTHDLVLAHAIVDESPSANHLWDTLLQAMQHPAAGEPHRPIQLQVRPDERWTQLKPHVEGVGIEMVANDTLDRMNGVFDQMHEHLLGKPRPALLDMPGMTPSQVGTFFAAAAEFYRQAPWKEVADDATIQVECAKYQSGPWYAVVMGQSGMTLGLALYEDLRIVRRTQQGRLSDEGHAHQAVVLSVTFGEQHELVTKDLEAMQELGWKLAGPEAYPCPFKKERGLALRPPLVWELELLEGCLRAIPDFASRRPQDEPTKEALTVAAGSGKLPLVLSWVVPEGTR